MKVLFVCRENRGRGQIAAAFYNPLHPSQAESAGTVVANPELNLGEVTPPSKTTPLMREVGIDVSHSPRMRLTPAMLAKYDKIIVMAEPENTPGRLRTNPKTEVWEVEDTKPKSMVESRIVRDEIQARVADLGRRLHA